MGKSMFFEVWTKHENGSFGVFLLNASYEKCSEYVTQAVKKGADPKSLVIVNQDDAPSGF